MEVILGILIIIMAIVLVVSVLFQSGKEKGLSSTITGGADSFGGKSKKAKLDAQLNTVTTVLSIAFAVLSVVLYILLQA